MTWFVVALIIGLAGLILAILAGRLRPEPGSRQDDISGGVRIVGIVLLVVTAVILGFDCTTTVPTRNVGVQTSFGKPVGVLSNGFHLVSPWSKIETFDGTVQTVKADPVVRLANGTTATVDVSVQWQIDTGADFLALYRQYKTFDNIEKNVINRQLANSLNQVFETFDPLTAVDGDGQVKVQVTDLAAKVTEKLSAAVPAGLKVINVTIPVINYSKQIEDQINAIIAASAATRVAEQQKQTALAVKAANDLLAGGNTSPGVLYQNCLSMVERVLKAGLTLPPGFSCGSPGASVVIPVP